ncbi:hypothetical protein QA600_04560 [Natronococcus sp. A-GB1]|uniref:hypothetical protein n=1 Tax=Natronococcus sp. A-GB1 TaxID=3037648 RepID=UPI00241F8196|nr:hypothetical protein [Natronococcus sp. A-GB1]MDG5758607.1 hypothetical protein [Natronococcus sp. A-GB1]
MAGGLGAGPASAESDDDWTEADVPSDVELSGTAISSHGPVAAGEGGVVLARRVTGWEPIIEVGPTTESNPLNDIAVTDDGRHVWFAGGSGVIGRYDVEAHQLTDYSAPEVEDEDGDTSEKTSTWEALDVAGDAGEERVVLANGSGEALPGELTDDGGVDWGTVIEPGAGTTITGVALYERDAGFVADSEGSVYETTDGGESWSEEGVYVAEVGLEDIAAAGESDATAVGESGFIYEYNDPGWDEADVGEETVLAVSRNDGDGLAVGASGFVYERTDDETWEETVQPAESDLRGAALGTDGFLDVAVGASATAIEQGSYPEGTDLPQTITLSKEVPAPIEYTLEVNGEIAALDADTEIEDGTVEGTLGNGDEHEFAFDGRIDDFEVSRGPLPQLNVSVNGLEVSPLRLSDREWSVVDVPIGSALYGAAAASSPIAAGEGGRVLRREDGEWYVVADDGPTGNESPLNDAAATADGDVAWVAGGSGVVGRYDLADDELEDFSAPMEMTSTWEAVAVGGDAGSERVVLANGSGEVLPGEYDGESVDWGDVVEPGGGSSVGGASFLDDATVYVSDTNSKIYRSDDAGESWEEIGIDGGSVALTDVAASDDDVHAAGGDGSTFRYNGAVWTKKAAADGELLGVDRRNDRGVAVGASGTAATRRLYGWEADETPTDAELRDVVLTDDFLDIAVGGEGTVLERDRR